MSEASPMTENMSFKAYVPVTEESIRAGIVENLTRGIRQDVNQATKDIATLSLKVYNHEGLKGYLDQIAQNFARRIDTHEKLMRKVERDLRRAARRARRQRR